MIKYASQHEIINVHCDIDVDHAHGSVTFFSLVKMSIEDRWSLSDLA